MNSSSSLSIVRDVGDPLGLFLRPGRDDHTVLKQLLSEGQVGMLGAIFDPCYCGTQEDLKAEILQRRLDAILDTGMMELATPMGYTQTRRRLPWGGSQPHLPTDFDRYKCDAVSDQIARFVSEHQFSAVLAPTHFLQDGDKDPWFSVDKQLVTNLRHRLDLNGCENVMIYYPLAIPMRTLAAPPSRIRLKNSLRDLPLDAIWLRIHRFGSSSGDTMLRRYILACYELHTLGLPLVAEKAGTLALALLAFGAVAGIDCGVSSGEQFNFTRLKKVPSVTDKFRRAARVYFPDLCTSLTRAEARSVFETRILRQFACRNTECCRRGLETMIEGSRRHFAYARMGEVARLSRITPSMRRVGYLEEMLRPATDNLGRVLSNGVLSNDLRKKLEKTRNKQDGWRATLGQMSRTSIPSFSPAIERRVHRDSATLQGIV